MGKRDAQKAETRAQLLAAARTVFAEKGYDQAAIKDVARAAGVAAGTVYTHFSDKSALAVAAFEEDIARTVAEAWATLPAGSIQDRLVHIGARLLGYYNQHPALSRALLRAILFAPRTDGDSLTFTFLQRVGMLIGDGRFTGEVRQDADIQAAAQAFFAAYYLILIGGMAGALGPLDAQVAALRRQVALLFDGIKP